MPRRIEVELTSSREDGVWTWRAAGARQPKGELDGALLYEGAKVGDVVRADAEFDVEGIQIVGVLPPKGPRKEPERIEIIGRPIKEDELVTSQLAPKGRRSRDDGDREGRRPRRPRRDRDRAKDGETGRGEADGERRGPRRDRRQDGARDGEGEKRQRRERGPRAERTPRPQQDARPKPKRLRPGRKHRSELVAALPEEERPIAEQVLRGGIPAVRQAIDKQNQEAVANGQPTVNGDALVAIAERILPKLRSAEWLDRADAALANLDELDLRDLRSVVTAADGAARDEQSRALAAQLREGLSARVESEHAAWLEDMKRTLTEGRVVRSLRLSSRPPKAGSPLPGDVAGALISAASEAFGPDITQERWATVLDAVAYSPVRQQVKPVAVPTEPSENLLVVVRKLASRVPEIAKLFGIEPEEAPNRRRRTRKPAAKADGTDTTDGTQTKEPTPEPAATTSTEVTDTPTQPEAATTPESQAETVPAVTEETSGEVAPPPSAEPAAEQGAEAEVEKPESSDAPSADE